MVGSTFGSEVGDFVTSALVLLESLLYSGQPVGMEGGCALLKSLRVGIVEKSVREVIREASVGR